MRTGDDGVCGAQGGTQKRLENLRKISFFILILVFDFCCLVSDVQSLDTTQCTGPLGMETGEILDSDITASSSFDAGNTGPQIGRVRVERQGGAWCPKNPVTSEAEEWLQIDLHVPHVITGTEIQGRFGNGQGMEFAESYLVSYWRPTINKWIRFRDRSGNEILKGNINTYLPEKSVLDPAIIATKVRIMPHSKYRRTVCLRAEIYGCPLRGGLLSYDMQQGSVRGEGWELYDHTYDGVWNGHYLSSGLGALTDGRVGPNNLKDDFYNEPRGKGWVGWKNESRNGTDPLEIIFQFDSIREFNTISIYASNQFTEMVQVFSKAKVHFSISGKIYLGEPIIYTPAEDCIFEDPKNITIKLHHRVGQYVKLQLYWASEWILLSEIAFDSLLAMGNFTAEEDLITTSTAPPSPAVITAASSTPVPKAKPSPPSSSSESFKTKRNESEGEQHQQQPQHHQILVHQVHQIPEDISVGASSRVTDDWSVSSVAIVVTAVLSSFIAIVVVLVIILTAMVVRHKLITLVKLPGSSQSSLHYGGAAVSVVNDHHHHHSGGSGGVGLGPSVEFTTSSDDSPAKTLIKSTQLSIASTATVPEFHEQGLIGTTNTNFSSFKGSTTTSTCTSTFHRRRGSFNAGGSHNGGGGGGGIAEFYSCSLVSNSTPSHLNPDSCNEYEYVLPSEFGKLLPHQQQSHLSLSGSSPNRVPPESASASSTSTFQQQQQQQSLGRNRAIHLRFRELGLPEISRHRLNILRNLGEGTFGTVFVGELEKCGPADRRLVIVKRMLRNATEKDKLDFIEEIRLLSALKDSNVTQVLGVSSKEEEPCSVILEFLELGDMCQFLRQNDNSHPAYSEKLSLGDLLYMACQIASGMKYFESRNIVHRDLAARNCVVGRGLVVKISHFASDMDVYASDYYRLDGKTPFPVRWMAWESIFLGKYSTRSDVWSFGVLLWELCCFCRHSPYHALTNSDVITNLQHLSIEEEVDFFEYLEKPPNCPRDIYQLMCDTWCRNDEERPTFWEIHCFLSRKSITFCAEMINKEVPAYIEAHNNPQQYIV